MTDSPNQPAIRPARAESNPRIALITTGPPDPTILDLLGRLPVTLTAQGGMRQADAAPGIPWIDDTRVLITQSPVDAIVLLTSTRAGVELAGTAAAAGKAVFRTPPLGRTFAEAAESIRQARQHDVLYHVASWWDQADENTRWARGLIEGFRPGYTELRSRTPGPPLPSWRSILADAGGGVLMADAYPLLEALVALEGLPEVITASIGRCRRRPGEAPRETEDVALALLRYPEQALTTIAAAWDVLPFEQQLELHGAAATLVLAAERVELREADGRVIDHRPLPALHDYWRIDLARFCEALRNPASQFRGESALERHLAVTALLETLYLSARTGQPETPRKLYEVQGWPEPAR
jgi:predicted dehydrogenase